MNDGWRGHFPVENIADLGGVADWAGECLERLGESPLHPAAPQQSLVVRLLCLPSSSPAFTVRAEAYGPAWRLSCRDLSEESGFELIEEVHSEDRLITGANAERLNDLWEYLRFWSINPTGERNAYDGTTYVMEAAEQGRYRVVSREDPGCDDTFGEFSEVLLGLAGLAPR